MQPPWSDLDLEALRRLFEERLAEQREAHHGGSPGWAPAARRPSATPAFTPAACASAARAAAAVAVKVAGERRYRGYRTDAEVGVRQFELALRRLRRLSIRNEGLPDELDLDETIDETADHAGRL